MASSSMLSRPFLASRCLSASANARRLSAAKFQLVSQLSLQRGCEKCLVQQNRGYPVRRTEGRRLERLRRGPSLSVCATGESVTTEVHSEAPPAASFKHILLPIIDSNPYLSSGTRAAASTATSLARAFGSDITVAVVDEGEYTGDKELRSKTIRWHLAEGGFDNFALIEKEGQNPGAAIGEIADDLNLDLVVLGMESIHSKQIDGNTLAEFVPCPVLLLP